ncbi:hypothetical protein B0H10DRAFT_2208038 [Mycena sp. CBHHK59/15]|nr:hypothetical protein B0H10DRAFT_2208038 [Mycena sp. CBHHK59/15]
MSAAQALEVEDSYMNTSLKLFNYEYPEDPATKGVAIVLNREITNIEGVKIHYLIPGRVMLTVIPWHGNRTLTILAIYAPTESDEAKIKYWDTLCDLWLTEDLPVPDASGGDFNLVADALDRFPHHTDPDAVVAAYLRFVRLLELKDGWRQNNPDIKAYTHPASQDHAPHRPNPTPCHPSHQNQGLHQRGGYHEEETTPHHRQRERKWLETRVRGVMELNHIMKYAVNIAKDPKPRDTLTYLRRTDIMPERGSCRLSEMAEIACDYHNDLQADQMDMATALRDEAREEALDSLPQPGTGADMKPLSEVLMESNVMQVLMEAASGKAASINGYVTEFWHRLEQINKENAASGDVAPKNRTCDIVKVLTWVFNDIETFGMMDGTEFSLGWMCPLFKKKDRTDIVNYHPITGRSIPNS